MAHVQVSQSFQVNGLSRKVPNVAYQAKLDEIQKVSERIAFLEARLNATLNETPVTFLVSDTVLFNQAPLSRLFDQTKDTWQAVLGLKVRQVWRTMMIEVMHTLFPDPAGNDEDYTSSLYWSLLVERPTWPQPVKDEFERMFHTLSSMINRLFPSSQEQTGAKPFYNETLRWFIFGDDGKGNDFLKQLGAWPVLDGRLLTLPEYLSNLWREEQYGVETAAERAVVIEGIVEAKTTGNALARYAAIDPDLLFDLLNGRGKIVHDMVDRPWMDPNREVFWPVNSIPITCGMYLQILQSLIEKHRNLNGLFDEEWSFLRTYACFDAVVRFASLYGPLRNIQRVGLAEFIGMLTKFVMPDSQLNAEQVLDGVLPMVRLLFQTGGANEIITSDVLNTQDLINAAIANPAVPTPYKEMIHAIEYSSPQMLPILPYISAYLAMPNPPYQVMPDDVRRLKLVRAWIHERMRRAQLFTHVDNQKLTMGKEPFKNVEEWMRNPLKREKIDEWFTQNFLVTPESIARSGEPIATLWRRELEQLNRQKASLSPLIEIDRLVKLYPHMPIHIDDFRVHVQINTYGRRPTAPFFYEWFFESLRTHEVRPIPNANRPNLRIQEIPRESGIFTCRVTSENNIVRYSICRLFLEYHDLCKRCEQYVLREEFDERVYYGKCTWTPTLTKQQNDIYALHAEASTASAPFFRNHFFGLEGLLRRWNAAFMQLPEGDRADIVRRIGSRHSTKLIQAGLAWESMPFMEILTFLTDRALYDTFIHNNEHDWEFIQKMQLRMYSLLDEIIEKEHIRNDGNFTRDMLRAQVEKTYTVADFLRKSPDDDYVTFYDLEYVHLIKELVGADKLITLEQIHQWNGAHSMSDPFPNKYVVGRRGAQPVASGYPLEELHNMIEHTAEVAMRDEYIKLFNSLAFYGRPRDVYMPLKAALQISDEDMSFFKTNFVM